MLITHETDDPLIVADNRVFQVENVESYNYESFNSWRVNVVARESAAEHHYFVIDTTINEAFSHWFFESAIWLPTFNALRLKVPGLKLLLRSRRTFKELVVAYFGIEANCMVYELDDGPNVCYFPDPITALNEPSISPEYFKLLLKFRDEFASAPNPKSRVRIILPRQKKENFSGNERTTDTSDIEAQMSDSIFHTDTVRRFVDQVEMICSAATIFVCDGAAFHVNGFVARDSTIVVFGNITDVQAATYAKMRAINMLIEERNSVYKIPYEAVGGTFHAATFRYEHLAKWLTPKGINM